ncbi:MAG TPA: hypothetical protein VK178_12940 [Opitutaceae bacterium]|nr:hypothetical protein [Opitutaceae bacterium]
MKPTTRWTCLALVCVLIAGPLLAATKPLVSKSKETPVIGTQLASTLTQITGIAISPMLGVSALGAYRWAKADTPEEKAALPWYAAPQYWITGLLIVGAVALKDAAGASLPPGWKKPLDVAETLENKLSGIVAAGAVIPFTLDTLSSVLAGGGGGQGALVGSGGLAMIQLGFIDGATVLNVLLAPFAVAVFLLVWITAHAINVLILLSPWGAVDAVLKSLRMSVLGLLGITHFMPPWAGILCSLVVIVASYFLAGWAFRLTVYGSMFCWDFFTLRRHRFEPDAKENAVFAGDGIKNTPLRTYGRLARTEAGKLRFRYRPWLVLPEKQVELPDHPLAVGRGCFYPTIEATVGDEERTIILLPPRYKGHEDAFARACGIDAITEVGLRRAWGVIKELFGFENRRRRAVV